MSVPSSPYSDKQGPVALVIVPNLKVTDTRGSVLAGIACACLVGAGVTMLSLSHHQYVGEERRRRSDVYDVFVYSPADRLRVGNLEDHRACIYTVSASLIA
jgi:hypothetical protein